jgi:hypothetical protein
MDWSPVLQFISDQWPALLVLLYTYFQGAVIRSSQAVKTLELKDAIQNAHDKIDKNNSGKSSADIVDEFLKSSAAKPSNGTGSTK